MRVLIISTMRNEASFVLEWIAYHRHIGVTDFLVFSNDCDDGTDAMLDRLQDMGIVTHVRSHSRGKKPVQWRALNKADRHPLTKAADWIYVTDVDEFLNIHAGAGQIADLFAACPTAQGFAIPWRMFGNAGVVDYVDAPMTSQFTQAAPEALVWPWRAVQFKSLFARNDSIAQLGVHTPQLKTGVPLPLWVDGNGAPHRSDPVTYQMTTAPRYGLAQINHYALGAVEGFLVKQARGKPNHNTDPIDLSYWVDRNLCDMRETSILRHRDAITEGVAALMDDPQLAACHHAGVAWRKARIATLLQELDPFNLAARLRQMPPTRLLPMAAQEAQVMALSLIRRRMRGEKS